jgi:23S rRNA pseudouridine2605 synthase
VTFALTSAKEPDMAQPPKRPFGNNAPARPAKPAKLRWDTMPVRKARPDSAPSKGALERKDGEERIAKLLARAGVASRREIERMIADKRITLNGIAIETPATVLKSLHGVAVDGKAVGQPAPTQLYMFHKPEGCLTAERDFSGRKTIYDVLPKDLPRLMPIGRLDLNTEGLLLLTNDGEFKRQMEMPSTGVERTYRARVFGDISQAQLEELIHGIEIDGVRYGKIDANLERRTGRNGWLEMTLTEGKNREVRRVLEHFELEVSRLIRTRYGPFVLDELAPGAVGEVRRVDLIEFRNTLK